MADNKLLVADNIKELKAILMKHGTAVENNGLSQFNLWSEKKKLGKMQLTPGGTIQFANPILLKMLGYEQNEIRGRSILDITHYGDAANTLRYFGGAIEKRCSGYLVEKRYQKKSGETVWAFVSVALLRNGNGLLRSINVNLRELASQIKVKHVLEKEEYQSQEIERVGVWEWEPKSATVRSSRECFQIFGLQYEANQPFLPLDRFIACIEMDDKALAFDAINRLRKGCRSVSMKFRVRRANDRATRYVECKIMLFNNEIKRKITGIVHDITGSMTIENRYRAINRNIFGGSLISSIRTVLLEKSKETREHADRLIELTRVIGLKLSLSESELYKLALLAALHDIGKIGIDDHILMKPGKLTQEELAEMKRHPEIGYRIAMASPDLHPIAECILSHHERWDGSGYPQGLEGTAIPLLARILAVADAYDAMVNDRPYRKAISMDSAITEIERNSGSQFDPDITKIFLSLNFIII